MDMVVNFKMVQQPRLWEKLSLSVSHLEPQTVALCCRRPLAVNFNLPNAPTQPTNATSSSVTTVSTSSVAQCQSTTFSESLCILAQRGQAFSLGACVYTLADDATDARYNLFRADCKIASDEAHSLADILSRRCAIELLHMHRLMLAYNITHAFLRSGATPWINDTAMSKALHLPMAPDGQTLLHKQAFVVSHFIIHLRRNRMTIPFTKSASSFWSSISTRRWNSTLNGRPGNSHLTPLLTRSCD